MGFLWWGNDDDEKAATNQAALDAAKQYVQKEADKLSVEYKSKFDAAQAEFDAKNADFNSRVASANSQIAEQQTQLDTYTGALTDTIQKFNSAGQEASIAAANNGTPVSYSIATQPIEQKGPSPLVIAGAALAAYFLFLKKGR